MKLVYKNLSLISILSLLLFTTCVKEEIVKPTALKVNLANDLVKEYFPSKNSQKIQLYESLSIKYNFPIDTVFTMSVDGNMKEFRINNIIEGQRIYDKLEWTIYNKDSLIIYPSSGNWHIPSGDTWQNQKIIVSSTLMVKDNDDWLYAQDENGQNISFIKEFTIWVGGQMESTYKLLVTELTNFKLNELVSPNTKISFMTNITLDNPKNTNPFFQTRFILVDVTLKNTTSNQNLEIAYQVDDERIIKITNNPLEIGKKYEVLARFIAQYNNGSGWNNLESEIQYKKAYIADDSVRLHYSYPCINQYHFLKNEYPKGYIRFLTLSESINTNLIGKDYSIFTRITELNSGEFVDANCSFSSDSLFLEYTMPSDFLENDRVYKISLHKLESGETSSSFYQYHFRTSKFNNSLSKLNDFTHQWSYTQTISTGVHNLILASQGVTELFDYWEGRTSKHNYLLHNSGLIQMEIIVEESSIFQVSYYKELYDLIARYPQSIKWRSPESTGIPPRLNTGYVRSIYGASHPGYLTPEIIAEGASPIPLDNSSGFRRNIYAHQLVRIVLNDYFDLRDYYTSQGWSEPEFFIVWFYYNNLKYKVNYTLPGLNHVTNSTVFNFYN